jgi:soluble lytic murein transglycosylase-like protein
VSPTAFVPRAVAVTCACALVAVVAPAAQAQPVHQVAPGESLWQIAAANGLSPSALAAANGLPPDSAVLAGQVVRIPAGGGAGAAPGATAAGAPSAATTTATDSTPEGAGGTGSGSPATSGAGSVPGSAGSVVVRPGDTLSAIAARAGVSVVALAGHNGLNASALLPAGRALTLPGTGAPAGAASSSRTSTASETGATPSSTVAGTSPAASGPATTASPVTTPATAPSSPGGTLVTAAEVGAAASTNGVPASLARAIAWQESGFDNGAVSSAGARGAMQVMPDTLTWINGALSSRTLDSSSAADNVQAGTLYLQHLLRETGGDTDQAAAAYYQGLSSVRRRGMFDDTKRYVANVRALRSRFGD